MMSDSEVTSLDIHAVESEPEKKPQINNKDDDDEVIFHFFENVIKVIIESSIKSIKRAPKVRLSSLLSRQGIF